LAGDIEKSITNLSNNKKFRYLDNLLNKDKFSDKQNAQKYIDNIIKKYQKQLDKTIEQYKKLNFNEQGARSFGDIYYRKVRFDEYATEEQKKIIEELHNKPQQQEEKKEVKPKEEKKEVKPKEEIKPIEVEPKKEIQKEVKKAEKQPKQKKQRKPKKEVDENLIAFGTVMVGVPKTMAFVDKKGKEKEVDVLTLKNNIKTKDKKKAIKLKTHTENNIKFDEGEKNDKGKIKFNSAEITLPEKMKYVDKNLKFSIIN
jgi:outer membrane biosynthesis protein TonB